MLCNLALSIMHVHWWRNRDVFLGTSQWKNHLRCTHQRCFSQLIRSYQKWHYLHHLILQQQKGEESQWKWKYKKVTFKSMYNTKDNPCLSVLWGHNQHSISVENKVWIFGGYNRVFEVEKIPLPSKGITGRARLIRSHSSARMSFELSGNSN